MHLKDWIKFYQIEISIKYNVTLSPLSIFISGTPKEDNRDKKFYLYYHQFLAKFHHSKEEEILILGLKDKVIMCKYEDQNTYQVNSS